MAHHSVPIIRRCHRRPTLCVCAGFCGSAAILPPAADLLAQTVELAPDFTAAWFALGEAHEKLSQNAHAIGAFRQSPVARDPSDPLRGVAALVHLGATTSRRNADELCTRSIRPIRRSALTMR